MINKTKQIFKQLLDIQYEIDIIQENAIRNILGQTDFKRYIKNLNARHGISKPYLIIERKNKRLVLNHEDTNKTANPINSMARKRHKPEYILR